VICRITGRVAGVAEHAVQIERDGLCYEVLVPTSSFADLQRLTGNDVTLFTIQYLEGNPAIGNLIPRLVGFLAESDRAFYHELLKVKGVSTRKALRAMAVPAHQFAAAIENGDERFLAGLPEIGKRTATQLVAQLRGRVQSFLAPTAAPMPVGELTDAQRVALEILVQWGDRRADAQRWIAAAVESDSGLDGPDAIVRAAYRVKHSTG